MVALEVTVDASGAVTGGAQATSALNGIATAGAFAFQQIGATNTALASFGSKLAVAATGLGAASTAMAAITVGLTLLSQRTREATNEWERLGDAVRKSAAELQARSLVGLSTVPTLDKRAQEQLAGLQASIMLGQPSSLGLLSGSTGLSTDQLLDRLVTLENEQALAFRNNGRFVVGRQTAGSRMGVRGFSPIFSDDPNRIVISPGQQRGLFMGTYRDAIGRVSRERARSSGLPAEGSYPVPGLIGPPNPNEIDPESFGPLQGPDSSLAGPDPRAVEERTQRLYQMGDMVGTAIGDVIFSLTQDLENGQQAILQTLSNVGGQLIGQAAREFTRTIVEGFK